MLLKIKNLVVLLVESLREAREERIKYQRNKI